MDLLGHLRNLPYDIVENMCKYLNIVDIQIMVDVAGSDVLKTFEEAATRKCSYVDLTYDVRLDNDLFERVFEDRRRCENIRELNLTFLYWIPAQTIRRCMSRMRNLTAAYLVDTQLGIRKSDCSLYINLKKLNTLRVLDKAASPRKSLWFNILYAEGKDFIISRWTTFNEKRINLSNTNESKPYDSCMTLFNKTWPTANCCQQRYKKCIDIKADRDFKKLLESENVIYKGIDRSRERVSLEDLADVCVLDLQVVVPLPSYFLQAILKICTRLISLKITIVSCNFNIFCLENAQMLHDFSYICRGNFQIDRFLTHLSTNNIKLKRLYLQFDSCAIFSKRPLITFLDKNPQLIFFVIECTFPKQVRSDIQRTLNEYVKSPICIYRLFDTGEQKLPSIPVAHFDIMGICLNL